MRGSFTHEWEKYEQGVVHEAGEWREAQQGQSSSDDSVLRGGALVVCLLPSRLAILAPSLAVWRALDEMHRPSDRLSA